MSTKYPEIYILITPFEDSSRAEAVRQTRHTRIHTGCQVPAESSQVAYLARRKRKTKRGVGKCRLVGMHKLKGGKLQDGGVERKGTIVFSGTLLRARRLRPAFLYWGWFHELMTSRLC